MRKYALIIFALFAALLTWSSLAPAANPEKADKILVMKSWRRMLLLRDGEIVKEYKISLGFNPKGAKMRRGDGKTPEGHYIIDRRNAGSRFHLALHVSYPDSNDINIARAQGIDPGGDIMIHGLPNGINDGWRKERIDWTAGCIAVNNKEIQEIWRLVPDRCPIEIRP